MEHDAAPVLLTPAEAEDDDDEAEYDDDFLPGRRRIVARRFM